MSSRVCENRQIYIFTPLFTNEFEKLQIVPLTFRRGDVKKYAVKKIN